MAAKSKTFRFIATVYRIWMMRHIDVPDETARELQKQMASAGRARGKTAKAKYIPVVAMEIARRPRGPASSARAAGDFGCRSTRRCARRRGLTRAKLSA